MAAGLSRPPRSVTSHSCRKQKIVIDRNIKFGWFYYLLQVDLNNVKRCVLFNYDPEKKTIDFRHYAINVKPVGVAKSVKKLMANKVPNLSRFEDVADFIQKLVVSLNLSGGSENMTHHSAWPLWSYTPAMNVKNIFFFNGRLTFKPRLLPSLKIIVYQLPVLQGRPVERQRRRRRSCQPCRIAPSA